MQQTRVACAALVVMALAGFTTACGGGGEPPRLSRAALVKRAESVCAAGQAEADRLRSEAVPGARGKGAAAQIDATLEVLDAQIRGFEDLRGPVATDDDLEALVRHLRAAADGLGTLRGAAVDDDLTVDEAIAANPDVVQRVNRSSAQASDDLVALGFLSCVGVTDG